MTAVRRWLALVVTAIVTLGVLVAPATSVRADEPDPVKPGTQYLGSCIQSARTVSLLVLLDRSGSLANTDPHGVRYQGLKTLLGQLTRLTRSDGLPLSVELAVSSFASDYTEARRVVGWTNINDDPTHSQALIDKILVQARQGTSATGQGTNYQDALEGALRDLNDRSAPNTCRVLVWFTDGGFNQAAAGVDAARASMCAPNGLLDAIRRLGVVIIGLQLGPDEGDLRSMALGKSGSNVCGTYPPGEGVAPGIYLNASDVGQLSSVFGQLSQILQGCTDAGTSGTIDPGIRRMFVSAPVSGAVTTFRLQPPDAPAFDAPAVGGASHAGGYSTQGSSTDGLVAIEVAFPSGKGAGQWGTGATTAVDVHYCVFADLGMAPLPNQIVRAAPATVFKLRVVDRGGAPASLSDYATASVAASVVGPDGKPRIAKASFTPDGEVTLTFDAQVSDARVDYSLRLNLTTKSGLVLPPVTLTSGLALALSEDYPIVTPIDKLDLGRAVKRNPTQADLTLVGSTKGATQVCFAAPTDVQVPAAAKGTTLDYQQGCVDLATSQTKKVTVRVSPVAVAVGDGAGFIPVRLVPVASTGVPAAEFKLPTVWRFEDPFNPWVLGLTAGLITLLSVALPLLALGLANWYSAKFDVNGLRHAVVPVRISGTTMRRQDADETEADAAGTGSSQPLITTLTLDRVRDLGGSAVRQFRVVPVSFKSKARPTPGSAPRFWVEPPPGYALVCSTSLPGDPKDGSRASVPPGLGFVAILVCAVDDLRGKKDTIPGTLVVVTGDPSVTGPASVVKLAGLNVEELRRHLKTATASVVPTSGASVPDDPFESPTTSRAPKTNDFPTA